MVYSGLRIIELSTLVIAPKTSTSDNQSTNGRLVELSACGSANNASHVAYRSANIRSCISSSLPMLKYSNALELVGNHRNSLRTSSVWLFGSLCHEITSVCSLITSARSQQLTRGEQSSSTCVSCVPLDGFPDRLP